MSAPRGTTPQLYLTFDEDPELDLTQAASWYVTLSDGRTTVTKTGDALDVYEKEIDVTLQQEDTLGLKVGRAEVQANWVDPDGQRGGSEIGYFQLTKQLLDEVLT